MTCKQPKILGLRLLIYGSKKKMKNMVMDYLPYEKKQKARKMRRDLHNRLLILGGMVLVNIATFPSLYRVLFLGDATNIAPASMSGLLMCGLIFYLAYSLRMKLWLYSLGELIGIICNCYLLIVALNL
jgi:hypothetical protein|tara:strand:+ start:420 stop:803 length:384 start_codon:yes stop_codon:yes gene_type:complete